ncbi:MAG TPA: response regulator [Kofleriaceae bacterium]|nr:response regulator [Kofleriaceae bacterium]
MIRALIVDDDALVARTMGRLLSRHLEVVDAVCDAETAMRRLEIDPIDVVITDFDLGDLSGGKTGLDLAEEVRRQFPQIRIIMVSGSYGAPRDDSGVIDAFFAKPVQVADLLERVRGIVQPADHAAD